ncbi:Atrophin-1 multi-domain protein [Herminiimonas fonticola]|uniref:Atrophin-1 multi-domain protein n=1 Tax=Herminiimonas fonticola TaxID=303380 RepID=UPI003341B3A7
MKKTLVSVSPRFKPVFSTSAAVLAGLLLAVPVHAADAWGTYGKPFAATSPWNSRPVAPVFDDFVIPVSTYKPGVAGGEWSTGVFLANAGDAPMTVTGLPKTKGLWDPDAETFHDVTVPRWPVDVVAASASDGHADIVDPVTGIVHSFWQLKKIDGKWVAAQYAWTRIDGRGWGDPAHYFQGSRAAGVPTAAGLIRKHEINDGDTMYRHALAMSLTFNALSPNPTYIFPATSADTNAATTNTGKIPEGALLMLPSSYDTQKISNPDLRKVAETLKTYGAYVVDRNFGTPFFIYVENGAGFDLHKGGWNNAVADDLERIRHALRQVKSAQSWVDGNGKPVTPQKNFNLLSMRGPWQLNVGTVAGVFDTWQQAVVFPASSTRVTQVNYSSRGLHPLAWAAPQVGKTYRVRALASGGAKLRLQVREPSGSSIHFDSGELGNGESKIFTWPSKTAIVNVHAISGVGEPSTVRGELLLQD